MYEFRCMVSEVTRSAFAIVPLTRTTTEPCGFVSQVLGSLQNYAANLINGLSVSYGSDFLYGTGTQTLYGGGSVSVNLSPLQFSLSYSTSNSLQGFVYGAFGGFGPGFGRSTGPVASGGSTSFLGVGGFGVLDLGLMASGSMDENSVLLPAPSIGGRGEMSGGFGVGAASGQAQTTTYATPPLLPQIPTSSCHL